MLFVTNRFPTQSVKSRRNRRWTFDIGNNAAMNSLYFCEAGPDGEHTEILSGPFFRKLRRDDCNQVLLYVHGFNVPPATALEQAGALQDLFDATAPSEVRVVPMIWPTDDDPGVLKDYWDDQRSADLSGFAFARGFAKFLHWQQEQEDGPCDKRINILAHSMGNRVLREALVRWSHDDLPDGVPMLFRNAFLLAADMVNETLERGQPGELICRAARNVAVYHASDDLALRASKVVNLRNRIASRRLGHTGPERLNRCPPNVYSLDCDEVNMLYDRGDGHTYFLTEPGGGPGEVFKHILETIRSGRVFGFDIDQRLAILRA